MVLRSTFAAIALVVAGVAAPTLAADKYVIDSQHVWVRFSIQHNVWAKALGSFRGVKGEILFDEGNVAGSSVTAEIDAASVDTLDESRDSEVKGDFLHVIRYPNITFTSTKVEKTGEKEGNVVGDLTISGKTKPVTLSVTFNAAEVSPFNGKRTLGFSAHGRFNTNDFEIRQLKTLDIGPALDFEIEVEAIKE